MNNTSIFSFWIASDDDAMKRIKELSLRKVRQNTDIFVNCVCDFFYDCVYDGDFRPNLNAAVTPVFKRGFRRSKCHYRRASILPIVLKIFEKLLSEQLVI